MSSRQRRMSSLMGAETFALASAVAVHTASALTMYGCASTTMRASWIGVSTCSVSKFREAQLTLCGAGSQPQLCLC